MSPPSPPPSSSSLHLTQDNLFYHSQSSMFFTNSHTGPSGTVKLAKKEPAAKPTAASKDKKPAAKVNYLDPCSRNGSPFNLFPRKPPKQQNPPALRQPVDPKRPTRNPPPPKRPQRRPPPPKQQRPKPPPRPKPQKPTRRPNV